MVLVIDANRTADFSNPQSGHATRIVESFEKRNARLAVGGKLLTELSRTKFRSLLAEWARAGLLVRVKNSVVDAQQGMLPLRELKSNDAHVVALMRASGARLIYTADAKLVKDIKNLALVSPKGKVLLPTTRVKCAQMLISKFGN